MQFFQNFLVFINFAIDSDLQIKTAMRNSVARLRRSGRLPLSLSE
jgi:hypothetical protein